MLGPVSQGVGTIIAGTRRANAHAILSAHLVESMGSARNRSCTNIKYLKTQTSRLYPLHILLGIDSHSRHPAETLNSEHWDILGSSTSYPPAGQGLLVRSARDPSEQVQVLVLPSRQCWESMGCWKERLMRLSWRASLGDTKIVLSLY